MCVCWSSGIHFDHWDLGLEIWSGWPYDLVQDCNIYNGLHLFFLHIAHFTFHLTKIYIFFYYRQLRHKEITATLIVTYKTDDPTTLPKKATLITTYLITLFGIKFHQIDFIFYLTSREHGDHRDPDGDLYGWYANDLDPNSDLHHGIWTPRSTYQRRRTHDNWKGFRSLQTRLLAVQGSKL